MKVTVSSKADGSFYCKASVALKKGESMITLPLGVCLDSTKATQKFGPLTAKLRTGQYGMLALLLLSEKALGDSSKYATYVNSLPTKAPGILSWSDAQIQELISSTTRNVQAQLDAIAADWDNVVSKLQMPSLPPSILTKEQFTWAMGIVKARSVYLDKQRMLIPGMDFIEFDPLSTADPVTDSAGIFGGRVAKVTSERSYEQGEVVVMSYGLKSSAECLEDHSIIPDIDVQLDSCCEITCTIDGTEKYPDDKLDVLERNGYGRSRRFDLESDSSTGMDPSLLQFLRLKMLEGKDCFILEACFSDSVFYTLSSPFSRANELKVFRYLVDYCKSGLERVNSMSSVEGDETISQGAGTGPEECMARLRLQERQVLKTNLDLLTAELIVIQGPDTREYYQERRLRELNLLRPLDESEVVMPGERGPMDDNY